MDIEAAREFARTHHRAVLSTIREDGAPQMSPVLVAVDEQGRFIVSTRETAWKTRNLRRRPRAWLCILSDQFFGDWVQVEGPVEIIDLPDAMDLLIAYYQQISGEHPDWDEYRAAMESEQRVVVAISASRAGPDVAG